MFLSENVILKEFLQNYIPAQAGKMVDIETGNVIGDHSGIMYYTIGQRKGLGLVVQVMHGLSLGKTMIKMCYIFVKEIKKIGYIQPGL